MEDKLMNLKVRDDLHRKVKVYAAGRGEGLQELTERVLEREIAGIAAPSLLDGLKAADRALVERIAELARSNTDPARARIDIIRKVAKLPLPGEIE